MKKYILSFTAIACFAQLALAQVDRTKAPSAGPAPKIQVGKYESFTLKNGLKVFVVENHKLPLVSYSLVLDNDPIKENDKAGYVQMVGELLSRGTKTRTKSQLDEEIDFIGANISASATGIYGSSLKKHNEKLLQLLSDIVLNPTFPADEFEKIKVQTLSGLASEKNDPGAISRNISNVLTYGKDHPYGEIPTEKTIEKITVDDISAYYKQNFMPNVGYLAIVGDITKAEAMPLIEKYFGAWAKGTPVKTKYATPVQPSTPQISMHDRSSSVQSSLNFVYPVTLKLGDADYIKTRLLNNILGGSSRGRLFRNLREGHGYTYGAYSNITADKLAGEFSANAEVRTSVTDSAIFQFIYELNRMNSQGVTAEELDDAKKELTGRFAMTLENPQTIANFAINIERYKLAKDYYENYLTTMNAVTLEEVNDAARRYVLPYNFNLVIVGARDSIERQILQYDGDQKITFYDNYGKMLGSLREVPAGVTAETVIDAYIKSVGGKEAIAKISDITTKMSANVGAPYPLEIVIIQKDATKMFMSQSMNGQSFGKMIFNGTAGKNENPQGGGPMTADEIADAKFEAIPFIETRYAELQIKTTLLGIDLVDDEDAYVIEAIYPNGDKEKSWFSVKKGLKIKSSSSGKQGQSTMTMTDYKAVNGVLFPFVINQDNINATVNSIEINTGVKDEVFNVK